MSRVTAVDITPGDMERGALTAEYDVPHDAWFFAAQGERTMPFAALLEVVLQPCGTLAVLMGISDAVDTDLSFRNLDGDGHVLAEVDASIRTLRTTTRLTNVARLGEVFITRFTLQCVGVDTEGAEHPVMELDTAFGFFADEALARQAGIAPEGEAELFARPANVDIRLDDPRWANPSRPQVAAASLRTCERIVGLWPGSGEEGAPVAELRAERQNSPRDWYFRAHFYQDPVQPGSIGLEGFLQILRVWMLHEGLDEGLHDARFVPIASESVGWRFRGQILPWTETSAVTMRIVEAARTEEGAYARAEASLWADGLRIYTASFGLRIVQGALPARPGFELDPARDTWLHDHRPTWSRAVLPMAVLLDRLARGARGAEPVVSLHGVAPTGWVFADTKLSLRTCHREGRVVLQAVRDGEVQDCASARVQTGRYAHRPNAWPQLGEPVATDPYADGTLFHGPSYQVLKANYSCADGASALLSVDAGVPKGILHPALLDGAFHAISYDRLQAWFPEVEQGVGALPALVPQLEFFGPVPDHGPVRCEVRPAGLMAGDPRFPTVAIQWIGPHGVWAQGRVVLACFPLGLPSRRDRVAFIRDHLPVPGARLSTAEPDGTVTITREAVRSADWLPGTVASIYGTEDLAEIALRDAIAAAHGLHPGQVREQLPLTRFDARTEAIDAGVRLHVDGGGRLDLSPLEAYWAASAADEVIVDLNRALLQRFVRRVVIADPARTAAVRGRPVLYLANHQVGVESLMFALVGSALQDCPMSVLVKAEHRDSWLGTLDALSSQHPAATRPGMMIFFDRDAPDLARLEAEISARVEAGHSILIHAEGHPVPTRAPGGEAERRVPAVGPSVRPARRAAALRGRPSARRSFPSVWSSPTAWRPRTSGSDRPSHGRRSRTCRTRAVSIAPSRPSTRSVPRWTPSSRIPRTRRSPRRSPTRQGAPTQSRRGWSHGWPWSSPGPAATAHSACFAVRCPTMAARSRRGASEWPTGSRGGRRGLGRHPTTFEQAAVPAARVTSSSRRQRSWPASRISSRGSRSYRTRSPSTRT